MMDVQSQGFKSQIIKTKFKNRQSVANGLSVDSAPRIYSLCISSSRLLPKN